MDELIDAINKLATELLQNAQELDDCLGEPNPDHDTLRQHLRQICGVLTKVVESLERESSPLRRLVRMLDGTLLAQSLDRLADYIADHRATLIRLRVSDQLIQRVVVTLQNQAQGNSHALDMPQTLSFEDAIIPLKSIRDLVCRIATAADIAEIVASPAVLKQIVGATLGAATIIVDITGAVAASPFDPIGWVLVKAVKSVWAGATMVRGAVREIEDELNSIRDMAEQRATEKQIETVRKKAGKVTILPKRNNPGT